MGDDTTLLPGATLGAPGGAEGDEVPALVVAWCADDPGRVGEVTLLDGSGPFVLGRGEGAEPAAAPSSGRASPGATRLGLVRQRPGENAPTSPLASKAISREQLRLKLRPGAIEVERVGRCPLLVHGKAVDWALIAPGDALVVKGQLVLLATRRPRSLPELRHFPGTAAGAFGRPDEFGILGESPTVWRLRERVAFCAKAEAHVLLLGETGTGKELAARAIHALSARRSGPMVARNAATLPAGLIDAELFGNVKNYPNPGMPERPGLIGQARGGTLFLDEIGELSSELQAHLLRVVDEGGEYQRLGEAVARKADLRLLAATNRDPGDLKHDLLARLTLRVALPALADRREDVPLLVRHLLLRASRKSPDLGEQFVAGWDGETGEPRVDAALVERLLGHRFRLNVRELDGVLWRAMAASTGSVVALTEDVEGELDGLGAPKPGDDDVEGPNADDLKRALEQNGHNLAKTARALGLPSRFALYRLLRKRGLDPRQLRES